MNQAKSIAAALAASLVLIGGAKVAVNAFTSQQVKTETPVEKLHRQCSAQHTLQTGYWNDYIEDVKKYARTWQAIYSGEIRSTPDHRETWALGEIAGWYEHTDKVTESIKASVELGCSEQSITAMRSQASSYLDQGQELTRLVENPIALQQATI